MVVLSSAMLPGVPPGWRPIPADTSEDADRVQRDAYRRMGGRGRSQVMFRLTEMARRNARAGIRERHPDYDEATLHRAFCRLVVGDDLTRAIWPDHDLVEP